MVTQDNYLKKVFTEPPLVANKRQQNLKDKVLKRKKKKKLRIDDKNLSFVGQEQEYNPFKGP